MPEPSDDAAESDLPADVGTELAALRTRMLGVAALLQRTELGDEQRRCLRTIVAGADRALDLAAELGALLRLADSQPGTGGAPTDDMLRELADLWRPRALEKGLDFDLHMDAALPACAPRLREALELLLSLALEATVEGGIRIDARLEAEPDREAMRFTILDTREDVPGTPTLEARLRTERARRLVRLLGGELHTHAGHGSGGAAWFCLPCGGSIAMDEALPEQPPAAPALRILVAEDHVVNQAVIAEQIRGLGHVPHIVPNGVEALEAMTREPWDAVLLDCQMPRMDGWETARAIRKAEAAGGRRRAWIIAITAGTLDRERERSHEAGMDDYLAKPASVRDLAAALARVPKREPGPQPLRKASSRLVTLFKESGPPLLNAIADRLQARDMQAVARAMHTLGGGAGYLGAAELVNLCAQGKKLAASGDAAGLAALAAGIRAEYERVCVDLSG